MEKELLRFYPDITPSRVHVVGTPQFDWHCDESLLWSRHEFFSRVGGDPSRPLICFSGGDAGTCPEDPEHVRVLMKLIRAGCIKGGTQVLLRPSPVDPGGRYDSVREEFPELLYARPAWVHAEPGNWARAIPLPEDVQFLANCVHHSDLNVNVASTMTLDFAIRDKPVVNIAFDVTDPPPLGAPIRSVYYEYEHYRPVVELGAARIACSPSELATHVNEYIADPSLDREGRERLVELEVCMPLSYASERILNVLEGLGREGNTRAVEVAGQ